MMSQDFQAQSDSSFMIDFLNRNRYTSKVAESVSQYKKEDAS